MLCQQAILCVAFGCRRGLLLCVLLAEEDECHFVNVLCVCVCVCVCCLQTTIYFFKRQFCELFADEAG